VVRYWLVRLWSYPVEWWGLVSYAMRPYDMCLDARRWRWQRAGCWRGSRAGRRWQRTLQRLLVP
jgi:hypothetical protein